MVNVSFTEFQVDIKITDSEGTQHVLPLQKLYEKIEPENSSFRFTEGKRITITLKKWLETKWLTL